MAHPRKSRAVAIARQDDGNTLFGAPMTFRASFVLTVLLDISLLAIAATIAAVISGL